MTTIRLLSLLSLITATGCAKNDDKKASEAPAGRVGGSTYSFIEGDSLRVEDGRITGTGALVFTNPLLNPKNNIQLDFVLEDGGSLELVTHADNKLVSGVSVLFQRLGVKLTATLKTQDTSAATDLAGMDPSAALSTSVDVHNDETPAHILVWKGTTGSFKVEEALLNSEDGVAAPGNGTGSAWGLILTKATVTDVTRDEPKLME